VSNLVLVGFLVALLLATASFLLLRTFFVSCISYLESFDRADLSWKSYPPIQRLLDPADFEYLRQRGVSDWKIRKLRVERRKIFRLCLRSMAVDFNRLQNAMKLLLVQSKVDRPDVAAALAHQRVVFYRNLFKAEAWLLVHACGLDCMPAIHLLQPLKDLHSQLRELASAHVLAGAAV